MNHLLNLPAPSMEAASYRSGLIDVMEARYIILFHPVSFHTTANPTIHQKYLPSARSL